MILTHPARNERKERQPEKKMQIGPKDATGHPSACVQHMVMIVPVDADVDEAENVAHEYGKEGCQRSDAVTMRNLHLQNHDRNDDRDDTVAEGLESVLAHACVLEQPRGNANAPAPPQQQEPRTAGAIWAIRRPPSSLPLKPLSTC